MVSSPALNLVWGALLADVNQLCCQFVASSLRDPPSVLLLSAFGQLDFFPTSFSLSLPLLLCSSAFDSFQRAFPSLLVLIWSNLHEEKHIWGEGGLYPITTVLFARPRGAEEEKEPHFQGDKRNVVYLALLIFWFLIFLFLFLFFFHLVWL